jgi:aspartyl/glutamyl-tRNA(Asn/Gln) amidotransferase C subunit
MEINNEVIEKLENLSKLKIKDKEATKKNLSSILSFMKNLEGVTSNLEQGAIRKKINNSSYRLDKVVKNYDSIDFLKNNSKVVNNSFEVPKIL